MDAFDPDYEKWPNFEKANCIDDVAAPGEMIFYPKDYWHQTETWPDEETKPCQSLDSSRCQQLPRSSGGVGRECGQR